MDKKKPQRQMPNRDPRIPRTEEAHKEMVLSFMQKHMGAAAARKLQIANAYDAFNNNQDNSVYSSQFDVFAGEELIYHTGHRTGIANGSIGDGGEALHGRKMDVPYVWVRLGKIRKKVTLLEGELARRGFQAQVAAINREAKDRKTEFRNNTAAAIATKKDMRMVDQALGQPFAEPANVPDDMTKLEQHVSKNYRDKAAMVMQAILTFSVEHYRYLFMRLSLFIDAVVAGECHASCEIRNGFPWFYRVNPLKVIYDSVSDDDFLTGMTAFMEYDYVDLYDAAEHYGMDKAKATKLYEEYKNGSIQWKGVPSAYQGKAHFPAFSEDISTGSMERVLQTKMQWVDFKEVQAKVWKDEFGQEFVQTYYNEKEVSLTAKEVSNGAKIEKRLIKSCRRATLLGGELLVEWGEVPYQTRSIDNFTETTLDVVSMIPYYINGSVVSLVDQLSPLQSLKEFFVTKLQLEIAKSGGKGISIDVSMMPPEWGGGQTAINRALYYLKGIGVHFKSHQHGDIPGTKSIEEFDTGVGRAIEAYLRLSEWLDSEMDEMSGITPTREGQITSANQLKGVTASSNAQSSLITEGFFQRFYELENRLLTKHLEQAKICWAGNPDKFRPAIGDEAFDFLVDNIDIDLQDYGVTVYPQPIDYENLKIFVMQAVSAGLPAHVGMKIMRLAVFNIEQAIDEFYEKEEERGQQQLAMQQQIAAEANASREAIAKMQMDRASVPAQIAADAKIESTKINVGGQAANIKAKGGNERAAAMDGMATEVFKAGLAQQEADLQRNFEAEQNTQVVGQQMNGTQEQGGMVAQ